MIWIRMVLVVIAIAFWVIAFAIHKVQRRAATCEVHSKRAGQVAVAMAWLCVALGVGVLAAAVLV